MEDETAIDKLNSMFPLHYGSGDLVGLGDFIKNIFEHPGDPETDAENIAIAVLSAIDGNSYANELAKRIADLYQKFGRFQHRLAIDDDEVTEIMDEMIELQWIADYVCGDATLDQLHAHQAEMSK